MDLSPLTNYGKYIIQPKRSKIALSWPLSPPRTPALHRSVGAKSRHVSVLEISPLPQVAQSGNRKTKAELSTVLTSTPNKRHLEEIRSAKRDTQEKSWLKQSDVKKIHVKGSIRSSDNNVQAAKKAIHETPSR